MKRILKSYVIATALCFCVTLFLVGILIANNNSRRLSFNEQYESVEIYNTIDEKVGISTKTRYFEMSKKDLEKGEKYLDYVKPVLSPVINNLSWLIDNINEIIGKS